MDFHLSPDIQALRDKTRQFIAEQVIPLENDERQSSHGPSEALRRELVARARAAGLLTPHASSEMGGLGLSHVAKVKDSVEYFSNMRALESVRRSPPSFPRSSAARSSSSPTTRAAASV